MDSSKEEYRLLEKARQGNIEATAYFFKKYQSIIYWKSAQYFLQGAEQDDLVQEGMIGLFKAIRDYNPEKETSFRSFAEVCINRQLLSAIKRAARQKNSPLNNSISLDTPMNEEGMDWTLLDVISEKSAVTPEDFLIQNEEFAQIIFQLNKIISKFERQVLEQYLEGKSYQEISTYFNKNEKSVDNALQRIKRKIVKSLK